MKQAAGDLRKVASAYDPVRSIRAGLATEGSMYIYLIKSLTQPTMFKIGRSKYPERRIKELKTGCPVPIELVGYAKCRSDMHAMGMERQLHQRFAGSRRGGEWFQLSNGDFNRLKLIVCTAEERRAEQLRAERLNLEMDHQFEQRLKLEFETRSGGNS